MGLCDLRDTPGSCLPSHLSHADTCWANEIEGKGCTACSETHRLFNRDFRGLTFPFWTVKKNVSSVLFTLFHTHSFSVSATFCTFVLVILLYDSPLYWQRKFVAVNIFKTVHWRGKWAEIALASCPRTSNRVPKVHIANTKSYCGQATRSISKPWHVWPCSTSKTQKEYILWVSYVDI